MKKVAHFILMVLGLSATPLTAENLLDVYKLSLKSDPELLAEAASVKATKERDRQALANFLPELTLSAQTGKTWAERSAVSFRGNADYNEHGYSLTLTQPLFRLQNHVIQNQAEIAIEGETARFASVEQSLIVRVAERYFSVLSREDDLSLALAEREAIAKQLEQMRHRFEVGLATITDVAESQAAYDIVVAGVIEAENALANSKESLRETCGQYLDQLAGLQADTPLLMPEPADINEWGASALVQNPSLIVAKANVDNAQQNIRLQRSGHYPTLDMVAQQSYSSQNDGVGFVSGSNNSMQKSVALQFNLPIYSGGSVSSKIREAEYLLDQAMQNEEAQRRAVTRQAREAFNGVLSGVSEVKSLKQAVISNEKALESSQAGYEVGTRTTVDVLDARRNLFSARRDYTRSRYDYILNTLRLKQAAGIVNVADLQQINSWLGYD